MIYDHLKKQVEFNNLWAFSCEQVVWLNTLKGDIIETRAWNWLISQMI